MALGAQRGSVLRMIIGHAMLLVCAGLLVGAGASLALTGLLTKLLFGTRPTDPAVLSAVSAILALAALLAAYLPARRAVRVDPTVALRYE